LAYFLIVTTSSSVAPALDFAILTCAPYIPVQWRPRHPVFQNPALASKYDASQHGSRGLTNRADSATMRREIDWHPLADRPDWPNRLDPASRFAEWQKQFSFL
jgi:hypothetical protein